MPEARARTPPRLRAAAAPLLVVRDLQRVVRRVAHPARRRLRRAPRARSSRCSAATAPARRRRCKSIMGIVPRREGSIVFEGSETMRLAVEPHRPPAASPTARRSAASSPASTSRRTCCCRRWCAKAGCRSSRSTSCSRTCKERLREPGHQAVGRRAADARDRPHPAHRRAPAAARRADRRPGAGRSCSRSGAPSRELKTQGFTILLVEQNFRFAATRRRPALRDGARPRRRHDSATRSSTRTWTSCTTTSACSAQSQYATSRGALQ